MLALSACAPLPPLPTNTAYPLYRQQAQPADWYARLSPELQAYYAPARGKQGLELLWALQQRVSQAEVLDYGEAMAYLYTVAESVPQGKENAVRAAYSNVLISGDGPSGHKYQERGDANGDGKKGDAINCEHTWPQAFFGKQGAMRSDLHHLFPTLSTPNSQRGSLPLGLASEGRISYATASGSYLVSRAHQQPVFEPYDGQKGNSARALLYFYLRYHDQAIRQGDYQAADFFVARLAQFRHWDQLDPVDAREQVRQEHIFRRQGNRNPFIDIPGLIDAIGLETFAQLEQSHSLLSAGAARQL